MMASLQQVLLAILVLLVIAVRSSLCFTLILPTRGITTTTTTTSTTTNHPTSRLYTENPTNNNYNKDNNNDGGADRRSVLVAGLLTAIGAAPAIISSPKAAYSAAEDSSAAGDESFASIAERARKISKDIDNQVTPTTTSSSSRKSDKCAYDFTLPMEGKPVQFGDIIRQEVSEENGAKVKAVLVVNMKQDDPVARKTIPELIALATKYSGRGASASNALAVIVSPTDQGYYEPDTSTLIRLKLATEYGYGINPATIVTDKVNMLGSGAHPFWRWLESTCRTPAGLGRIEGNFEKFLLDGRTGQPLRRYPRKYAPVNIEDDIEAVIAGRPLPPARANWQEEWREAVTESQRDTYRFEKGLNWFDQ